MQRITLNRIISLTTLMSPSCPSLDRRLFAVICANLSANSETDALCLRDVAKVKSKSKIVNDALVRSYRLCVSTHPENLPVLMRAALENEVLQLLSRPNALLIPVLFKSDARRCAVITAAYLTELVLCNDGESKIAVSVLRDLVKMVRTGGGAGAGSIDVETLVSSLLTQLDGRDLLARCAPGRFDLKKRGRALINFSELIAAGLDTARDAFLRSAGCVTGDITAWRAWKTFLDARHDATAALLLESDFLTSYTVPANSVIASLRRILYLDVSLPSSSDLLPAGVQNAPLDADGAL